jgi:hypothetical protein
MTTGQKPIVTVKAGGQVSAAIFENELSVNARKVAVLKASVQKRYKDKDGNFKSTSAFTKQELPLAIYCMQKAYEKMINEDSVNTEEMSA